MENKKTYHCETCGKEVETKPAENQAPECCDRPMQEMELPFCQTAATPEHARPNEMEEPCDDGRSGKI